MRYTFFVLLFTLINCSAYAQRRYMICSAKGSSSIQERYQLFSSSGNYQIDQATVSELTLLQSSFLVKPIFYFYNDSDGKNSKATDEVLNYNGPDGTVIFGRRLFNSEYIRTNGGTTIPIIIAHEYAHIIDFKYGALQNATPKQRELFADVFAGMYMFVLYNLNGRYTDIQGVFNCFEDLGDTQFGEEDEHGSADERSDAVKHGYNFMVQSYQSGIRIDLKAAIKEAVSYVKGLEDEEDED